MLSKHTGRHIDPVPFKRAIKAYLNSTDPAFADMKYVGKHRCQLVEELLYTLDPPGLGLIEPQNPSKPWAGNANEIEGR
jgi:hypothetical protein